MAREIQAPLVHTIEPQDANPDHVTYMGAHAVLVQHAATLARNGDRPAGKRLLALADARLPMGEAPGALPEQSVAPLRQPKVDHDIFTELVRRAVVWRRWDRQGVPPETRKAKRRFEYALGKLDVNPVQQLQVHVAAVEAADFALEVTAR